MDRREEDGTGTVEQSGVPVEETRDIELEPEFDDDSPVEDDNEEELTKDEDAIQTAKRILAKHKNDKADTEEHTGEKVKTTTEDTTTGKQKSKDEDLDEDLDPPIRLTADAKQAFKKWPKRAKIEFSTAVRQMEGKFTQVTQEAAREKAEARHITEAVRPYYVSKPELAAKGITEAQVVSGLVGSHQLLTHDDINVRRQKLIEIGQSIGVINERGQLLDTEQTTNGTVNNSAIENIINNTLQQRLAPVESYIESQNRIKNNQVVSSITNEIQTVMNETDSFGNYNYPELHDKVYHGQQVKPLVAGLVRSRPGLSYGQATKMAVHSLRALNGQSNTSNPTGLPTNNQHNKRAAEAGVSARGKTTTALRTEDIPDEAIQGDAMQTARWYINHRGR